MQIITPQKAELGSFISRASAATFRDADGVLQSSANDEARPIYNGQGDWLGIYEESAATQVFSQVLDFGSAYWTKTSASVATGQADPAEGTDGRLITGLVAGSQISRPSIAAGTYAASIFAKAGTVDSLVITDGNSTATFDLDAGTAVGGTITAYANGWYRCSLLYTAAGSHTIAFRVGNGTMSFYGANLTATELSTFINGSSRAAETKLTPTSATIVYSNVPLEDIPPWSSGTTYNRDDEVIYENNIYRVSAASTTDRPDLGAIASPPTWVLRAPVNRLRMFDLTRSEDVSTTNTTAIDAIIYYPRFFNGVGLININGGSALFEVLEPGETEPGQSISTPLVSTFEINSFYKWYFQSRTTVSRATQTNITGRSGSLLRVRLTPRGGTTRIGKLVVGLTRDIGQTQSGVSIRTVDQSPNERNEFGDIVLRPGRVTTVANFTVSVPFRQTDGITELAKSLASTNTVFIGEGGEGYGVTILYGYAQEYEATLATGPQALYRITVESI